MTGTLTAEGSCTATRVIDAVVGAGLATAEQVAALREVSGDDAGVGRELLVAGTVTPDQLSSVLEEQLGYPRVDLASYAPDEDALAIMDPQLARTYRVLPLFEIDGTLTVAIGGAQDIFLLDTIGAQLSRPMDAVLASEDTVSQAIETYFPPAEVVAPIAEEPSLAESPPVAPAIEEHDDTPPPSVSVPVDSGEEVAESVPQGVEQMIAADSSDEQAVDLDVLAVADEGRAAVLVSDVLEHAVRRGASRIHLLPYKGDFFVVFRIKGRLERIASAPLSMQRPLIEGFKSFAHLDSAGLDRPAVGRVHAEVAGKSVVLTVSSAPTVAGQRLVVSINHKQSVPRELAELGMSEAESRVLRAMVERGRGLLLVAAPVAGGRSTTYYALLQHAARIGKTVYSVERTVEHEIPAVAQVLVSPAQPLGAASYLAAGMRQDTDVMALDSVETVAEIHLAIEAAGLGKLVIATYAAGGMVEGVRRLLDMGAEPVSLANALTLGVGQRVARANCAACAQPDDSPLIAQLPGAPSDLMPLSGVGCPACSETGFAGTSGLFEVLPFTEPVRASIARGGSAEQIAEVAIAEGMRPMVASGLSKVQDGLVSLEELDRVLRFAR